MAKSGEYKPIEILAGVQPSTDRTEASTPHYTAANMVRFQNGFPEKIGGWAALIFDLSATIQGTIRTIFTAIINGKFYTVLGSNEKLYSLIGSTLTNITPLDTDDVAIPNSINTHYATLANDPLASTNGSPVLTVTDPEASLLRPGDIVVLSGATGFAGILAGSINGDAIVRSIPTATTFTINVGTNANATTTGGGASVVRTSGLITVDAVAHGMSDGDRVSIDDATTTGGILDTEINREFIIRNVVTDSLDIMTIGEATSSVTAGGGASTIYFPEIGSGALNEANVLGYGAGMYGAGLYGTALTSNSARSFPRIWFLDRYGDTIIGTPGNQTGLYQWLGSNETAPALISGAPTAINYAFESDNIIVTFGAEDMGNSVENRIYASDQNNITNWTSSSTNQVYDDDIEGAGRLISHVPVEDYNLIFTENKTYTFRYIGLPFIWEPKELDDTVGIIAPMARVNANGIAYWMGQENFYMYRGGTIEIIRANSQDESTCLNYVFKNINWGQKSKIFAWFNKDYSEVWFHYPTADSNEPNRVVVVNILEFSWTVHNLERTAAEYPSVKFRNPRLANVGTVYQHEFGSNDNGAALAFMLRGPKYYYGTDAVNVNSIIPDSNQTGDITFTNNGYMFPQAPTPTTTNEVTVSPTSGQIPFGATSRYHQFTIEGEVVDQEWRMGQWMQELQKGPRN